MTKTFRLKAELQTISGGVIHVALPHPEPMKSGRWSVVGFGHFTDH
jgi:hypothetical protein